MAMSHDSASHTTSWFHDTSPSQTKNYADREQQHGKICSYTYSKPTAYNNTYCALHHPSDAHLVCLCCPRRRQRGACRCWQWGGWTWQASRRGQRLHGWPGDGTWCRCPLCVHLWCCDVVLGVLQLLQFLQDLRHRWPCLGIVADALQGNACDCVCAFLRVLSAQLRVHDAVQTALVAQVGFCPVDEVLLRYWFWFV